MPQPRTLSRKRVRRGIVSMAQKFAQPEDSIVRGSNLIYSSREGLRTCDGTFRYVDPGSDPHGQGTVLSMNFLLRGSDGTVAKQGPSFEYLQLPSPAITWGVTPSIASITEQTGPPVNIPAGTYTFRVAALDGAGGSTAMGPSSAITADSNCKSITITITNLNTVHFGGAGNTVAAVAYAIYIVPSGGVFQLMGIVQASSGSTTAVILTTVTPIGNPISGLADTANFTFERVNIGYGYPAAVFDILPPVAYAPWAAAGQVISGGTASANPPVATVNGGIPGTLSPLPQYVSYPGTGSAATGGSVMALGNGYAPRLRSPNWTDISLSNNYTLAFPSWQASTSVAPGTLIVPATPNAHYYKAIQVGIAITGSMAPTFPTNGQAVADGGVTWLDQGSNAVPAPRGAAHAIAHLGFLWLWNTSPTDSADGLDGPSVLKQSDLNNPNSWNPVNVTRLGQGDGDEGYGLASFTVAEAGIAPDNRLIAFKQRSHYLVQGSFGSPTFSISKAKSDLGCIAPRSIQFIAKLGVVMRLTHKGFSITDGITDDPDIGEPIRPYLFGGTTAPDVTIPSSSQLALSSSAQTTNPPMYCCAFSLGLTSRILCYDVFQEAWAVVDLPFPIYSMALLPYISVSDANSNVLPSLPQTMLGGSTDGIVRRWQQGDTTWDANEPSPPPPLPVPVANLPVAWSVQGDDVNDTATDRLFYRRVLIRGLFPSSAITINASVQLASLTLPTRAARVYIQGSNGRGIEYEAEVPIGQTTTNANLTLSGNGVIEIDVIDWQVQEKPAVPVGVGA